MGRNQALARHFAGFHSAKRWIVEVAGSAIGGTTPVAAGIQRFILFATSALAMTTLRYKSLKGRFWMWVVSRGGLRTYVVPLRSHQTAAI
jgi:hypothetical protein